MEFYIWFEFGKVHASTQAPAGVMYACVQCDDEEVQVFDPSDDFVSIEGIA